MPILDLTQHAIAGSNYGFSGTRIEDLGASEYTLVGIVADVSGSVHCFRPRMEKCVKAAVKACRHSPRADNLMLRLSRFSNDVVELHGFRPLSASPLGDYDKCLPTGGSTALYDATHNAVSAITRYAKDLSEAGLDANAIVIVITDGGDNVSSLTAHAVRKAVSDAVSSESIESIRTILVGVNVKQKHVAKSLSDFQKEAGFDQYIELNSADESTLARLAEFMSRAIRSQSVALGSGGPSIKLTF